MYDLEILVPAEMNQPKIVTRFEDFKKYGLLNLSGHKVKLVLATSPSELNVGLKVGWPDGIDVEILNTPYAHVAQRNYHYYHRHIKPDVARWYMRCDEDSMTDIGGLLKNLDRMYDHDGIYHVIAEINHEHSPLDNLLLDSLGFGWWHDTGRIAHEYEVSITSNEAIRQITASPHTHSYFDMRQELPEGFGDRGLTYCARMVKIYPILSDFLTRKPEIIHFSLFGGKRNHVHEIGHDRAAEMLNWIRSAIQSTKKAFSNKICLLSQKEQKQRLIRLHPAGHVHTINEHDRFGLWHVGEDGTLNIYLHHNIHMRFDLNGMNEAECGHGKIKIMKM